MNRTKSALTILAVASALAIAGCSTDSEPSTPAMPATTTAATTTDAAAAASETTTSGSPTPDASDDTAMETSDSDMNAAGEPTESEITVTVGGTDTVIAPDQVFCSGEEGKLRHIIGKTNNQPPLVEATPGEFAMVKLDQKGAPYKSENPTGITFGDKSAAFDATVLGDATVNGSLVCTVWEN